MRYRGRRWNNILIFSVLVFIIVLNLPTIIKTYLLDQPATQDYPTLLDRSHPVVAMYSTDWSLNYHDGDWQSTPALTVPPLELVQRWKGLVGTEVPAETFQSLKSTLSKPQTVEVWYDGVEEPQRITCYRSAKFWIFSNWEEKWIAVSVEDSYLFPPANP